jgi:sensor c-di-GMP phosphodiesterase-like protein
MNKRLAVCIAVVIGLIAISAPIALSIYWAWRQSLNEQLELVGSIADDVLRRADASTDQVRAVFASLKQAGAMDPCSDENIRLMGKLDLASEQVQAIGYVANDRLLCSSYGRHDTAVGPPNYQTSYGLQVRIGVEFPVLPGRKFLLLSDAESGFCAAIHPDLPLDVFTGKPDISIGVYSHSAKRLANHRGVFKSEWLDRAGENRAAEFSTEEDVIAVRGSGKYPFAAYASTPMKHINEGVRRGALLLVPFGVAAGIALALAVLYVARQQLALPAVLKVALKRNEFFLAYQPIVELRGGRCVGAEALIRWRRPNGEMVRPDVFIPVAEDTGLIHAITKRVMEMVARDAATLLRQRPDLHIGINLSAKDLQMQETPHLIHELCMKMKAQPQNILVEATERGFMQQDLAARIMDDIHALKIRIAIDDFGTGYSSLSYLEKFKLDYLKIDKSFVDAMGSDAATSQVVPHIIEMAKSLKLEMIAEGVETEVQLRYLQERGVQYAQGWYFAKPMPFAEFAAYVAKSEKLAA